MIPYSPRAPQHSIRDCNRLRTTKSPQARGIVARRILAGYLDFLLCSSPNRGRLMLTTFCSDKLRYTFLFPLNYIMLQQMRFSQFIEFSRYQAQDLKPRYYSTGRGRYQVSPDIGSILQEPSQFLGKRSFLEMYVHVYTNGMPRGEGERVSSPWPKPKHTNLSTQSHLFMMPLWRARIASSC